MFSVVIVLVYMFLFVRYSSSYWTTLVRDRVVFITSSLYQLDLNTVKLADWDKEIVGIYKWLVVLFSGVKRGTLLYREKSSICKIVLYYGIVFNTFPKLFGINCLSKWFGFPRFWLRFLLQYFVLATNLWFN